MGDWKSHSYNKIESIPHGSLTDVVKYRYLEAKNAREAAALEVTQARARLKDREALLALAEADEKYWTHALELAKQHPYPEDVAQ